MTTFNEMQLPVALTKALNKMQFVNPTPIQAEAIPHALNGSDILGSAQTGTGKTAAFGIPLAAHLLSNENSTCLVMTPTRELAAQVMKQLQDLLSGSSGIKSALLIGGDPMPKQLSQLKKKPRLIVGTPGRINDHIRRGTVHLQKTDFVVLDETDRMLDMGFSIQIETIMDLVKKERQTLLFSATLPKRITALTREYLENPIKIAVDPSSSAADNVNQETIHLKESEKYDLLVSELDKREGSVVIFMNTKHATEKMADQLYNEGYETDAIHGDLRQRTRNRVLENFRKKKYRILVATDVAARGLDIPHIEHVINYDLPQCEEDYIHRIGRTARAGATGDALNLVSPHDKKKWRAIEHMLDPSKKGSAPQEERSSKGRGRGRKSNAGSSKKSARRQNDERQNFSSKQERRGPKKASHEHESQSNGRKREESSKKGSFRFNDKPKTNSYNRVSDGKKRSFGDKKASGYGRSGDSKKRSFSTKKNGRNAAPSRKPSGKPTQTRGQKRHASSRRG